MQEHNQLLRNMMGISQPDVHFWWPLTPIWYVLILFTFLLIGLLIYYWLERTKIKRMAINELRRLEACYKYDRNFSEFVSGVNLLLRKVALLKFKQISTAGLIGRQWLEFLDEQGKTDHFTTGIGQSLLVEPYQKPLVIYDKKNVSEQQKNKDANALIYLVFRWIRRNC